MRDIEMTRSAVTGLKAWTGRGVYVSANYNITPAVFSATPAPSAP